MRFIFTVFFLGLFSYLYGQSNLSKKITFGSDYDYPPYEFINAKGEYDGFHVDLIKAIGKEMGYEVEIQLGNWTHIRAELEAPEGKINVADMLYSDDRADKVDFLSHHDVVSYVLVRKSTCPAINDLSALKNKSIVVTAKAIASEFVAKNYPNIRRVESITDLHALKMLANDECDYALINQYTAHKFIQEHRIDGLVVGEDLIFSRDIAFVVKKGEKQLAKDIEEGMVRLKKNGTYSALYIKWFDNEQENYEKLLKRLKWIALAILLVGLLVGSWIWLLRKQVQRKTRKIRKIQELVVEKNKELEKRNYELDKFVYSISHQVRSPIASALGLINVIQIEFKDVENLPFYISKIGNSLLKLDYYVNKIMAYTTNKNFSVERQAIDFNDLIAHLLEDIKFLEGAEEVDFQQEIIQEADSYSDKERIYALLECLVANAIEYKAQREEKSFVKIQVKTTPTHINIAIEDNGVGIEKEQLEKVFEMFYRGNTRSKGTGLGLYVVKQIVEQLGGNITLQSNYREGSVFSIQIPNLLDEILPKQEV